MRIWSLHPKHLDAKGLVALWRETLLAKHVLDGKTKGYKNHPQLDRFKKANNPSGCIDQYLAIVFKEAVARGYNFSREKINWDFQEVQLTVTKGQFEYETRHLLNKLKVRDKKKHAEIIQLNKLQPHPIFRIVKGEIEDWEIIK